eukprot:6987458-Alexandrium_andersonii.AAC.1
MATDWRCGCGEDNWSSRSNCRNCGRRAPQSVLARNIAARREADRGAHPEALRSRALDGANGSARRASTGGPAGRLRRPSRHNRRKRS